MLLKVWIKKQRMKVRKAEIADIDALEVIASKSYKKMEFQGEYDSDYFKKILKGQIESDDYIILKCVDNNVIVGGLFAMLIPEMYSPTTNLIYQFAMQADPDLNKVKQGRILLSLIYKLEYMAFMFDTNEIAFSVDKKYDLSKYYDRNGYTLTEKKYSRRLK